MITALILLFLITVHSRSEKDSNPSGCNIVVVNGFLKYVCYSGQEVQYRCHNSEEYYSIIGPRFIKLLRSYFQKYRLKPYFYSGTVCSNDKYFYQACDKNIDGFRITKTGMLCGNWLCKSKGRPSQTPHLFNLFLHDSEKIYSFNQLARNKLVCDGEQYCVDNRDESNCEVKSQETMRSGRSVQAKKICNDFCDSESCEDEAVCNGLTYGLYCDKTINGSINPNYYVPPKYICDHEPSCDDKEDEVNCTIRAETSSTCAKTNATGSFRIEVPVLNYTRCNILDLFEMGKKFHTLYCSQTKKYQSNCTDEARVGGSCRIDGYLSTVSKSVICSDVRGQICDDNIEAQCLNPSKLCTNVHKHLLCDNNEDCDDRSDETHPSCRNQAEKTCRRKMGNLGEQRLPLTWIGDGIYDCIDGEDEMDIWPTCGEGKTKRLVTSNKTCENVFLCPWGDPGFVELADLCDGLEICGFEEKMCSLSRSTEKISKKVLSAEYGLKKQVSFCLKGFKRHIERIANDYCIEELFIFPDQQYFGVHTKTKLLLPNNPLNCDHVFGEQYVFSSCTNRCKNSTCPLKNLPRYEACPDQYPNRIGTIANNEYIVFFTQSYEKIYTNRFHVCDNQIRCIEYSQICDLVDDCGDLSDEKNCTNHFRCHSSGRLIPKTRKCDGQFDCFDMSDECNEECSSEILEGLPIKVISWVIGIIAVLANLIIMIKNVKSLTRCNSSVALINKSLIILISLGDFFVGCYLLVISIYDMAIFKERYCFEQIEWITSDMCSFIGVLSTIGSQVSLFAMAGLSLIRLNGVRGSLRISSEVNPKKIMYVTFGGLILVLTSTAISIIPLLRFLNDFFVNGVTFPKELRIFIGSQSKHRILKTLEAYYGQLKDPTLSWDTILKMISNVFSHDVGYKDHTESVRKQNFYGSDGVCLFKYFVHKDDPQREFVWGILVLNFICFLLISISYTLIGVASRSSSRAVVTKQNRNQINKRNQKINRRIAIIITTDFCCWVPFIVICAFHFLEVFDASPWYSVFSMSILPINSLINPLLYDDFITSRIRASLNVTYASIRISTTYINRFRPNLSMVYREKIEMKDIQGE